MLSTRDEEQFATEYMLKQICKVVAAVVQVTVALVTVVAARLYSGDKLFY